MLRAVQTAGTHQRRSRWLECSIFCLLVLLSAAIPVWTKAAVLLFRIALVLWIIQLVFKRPKAWGRSSLIPPLFAYLVLTAISSAFSLEPSLSWGRMRMVALLLLALLVAANIKTARPVRWMIAALLISTLVAVAYAALQYTRANGISYRVHGFFSHYVPFSELLMLIGAVAWGLLISANTAKKRAFTWILIALLAAIGAALLMTETRAALAALVISAVAVLWLVVNWKLRVLSIIALVIVTVFGSYWFQRTRAGQGWFDRNDAGTDYRLLMWEDGARLAAAHPWVGIGMDSEIRRGEQLGLRAYKKYPSLKSHFHSTPIQIAVECGLPALAAWLWLMIAYLILLGHTVKNTLRLDSSVYWFQRGLVLGLLASTIAFLLIAAVHYIAGDAEVMILFWLLMGIAMVLQNSLAKNAFATQADERALHSARARAPEFHPRGVRHDPAK